MAKKVFKYQLQQKVWPNEKSRSGYPSGLEKDGGIIISQLTDSIHFDYEVKFDDSTTCRYKEEELDDTQITHGNANNYKLNSNKEFHMKVMDEIHETYLRKNADYGNSFSEQYAEYGLISAVIRMDDKLKRLKQLLKQDAKVKDESIRDTVLDLGGYAAMTVMELDKK